MGFANLTIKGLLGRDLRYAYLNNVNSSNGEDEEEEEDETRG